MIVKNTTEHDQKIAPHIITTVSHYSAAAAAKDHGGTSNIHVSRPLVVDLSLDRLGKRFVLDSTGIQQASARNGRRRPRGKTRRANQLLEQNRPIRALARNMTNAQQLFAGNLISLELVTADLGHYDDEECAAMLEKAVQGCDCIISEWNHEVFQADALVTMKIIANHRDIVVQ